MSAAVASTEKIRSWVCLLFSINIYLQNEHMIDIEDLAKQLDTKIHLNHGDLTYYGLTDL